MKSHRDWFTWIPIYALTLMGALVIGLIGNRTVTALSESAVLNGRRTIIIDAGHGGEDGGASSCTGVLESSINLEISLRLNDLFHLLGYQTVMIRTTDTAVHTQGQTIAARKASDLKERVRIANETENGLLVSIHQNYYSDNRYSGAQVFYSDTLSSQELAKYLQNAFVSKLNHGSKRQAKKASGVYLMEHVACTAVLVECGFLSNPAEEANLRSSSYQNKVCSVIGTTVVSFLALDP